MENLEKIEIPFGAKDSELGRFEYTIPEGFEAKIENGKVIVRKMESEDEKIRESLIDYFRWNAKQLIDEFSNKEVITWLEKQGEHYNFIKSIQIGDEVTRNRDGVLVNLSQLKRVAKPANVVESEKQGEQKPNPCDECINVKGCINCENGELRETEQKPVVIPKFRVGDFVKDTNYHREPIYEIVNMDNECYICEYRGNKSMGDKSVMHFTFDNPYLRLVEQKPVEEVNGEDYGIDGLYAAMDILNKTLGQVEGYQSDDGILEHKAAMTAIKKLYKQKPVEWSEEDEKNYKSLENLLNEASCYSCTDGSEKLLNWLKSLRPQKVLWKLSEKEKSDLSFAVAGLDCYYRLRKNEGRDIPKELEDAIGTIHKIQDIYSYWKPTEEQMKVLSLCNVSGLMLQQEDRR